MKKLFATLGLSLSLGLPSHAQESIALPLPAQAAAASCQPVTSTQGAAQVNLRRTFFDDFETFDLGSTKWTPHYDGGYDEATRKWNGYDWPVKRTAPAAHEQEIYVDPGYRGATSRPLGLNPFSLKDGVLTITADRISPELAPSLPGFTFTSGILTTRKSFLQKYGYFEMRGKVPGAKNLLPAFWLLPEDRKMWPPELDIMEAPGHVPDKIATTVHWRDSVGQINHSGCRNALPGFGGQFHQYGALWTPERMVFYIDRQPVAQVATPIGFDYPMYMLVNLAVGGDWVGFANNATPMPVTFEIDNISAYTMGDPAACTVASNGVRTCQGQ